MDDTEWLQHIFGQSLAAKTNPAAGELANRLPADEALGLMTRIFSNCRLLLEPFSNLQVSEGLRFLAFSGESDWMEHVYNPAIEQDARHACARSIEVIFRDCFARRCVNAMSQNLHAVDPLSDVCFMWWDALLTGGDSGIAKAIDREFIGVMANTLNLPHVACQESALHGLGHWESSDPERVHGIVDAWLTEHPHTSPSLRNYAEHARSGNVL